MTPCKYHLLLAELAYYTTGEWTGVEQCPNPATRYTCVEHPAGTQHTNVCAEHEPAVRGIAGWRWSKPRVEVPGA